MIRVLQDTHENYMDIDIDFTVSSAKIPLCDDDIFRILYRFL